jgi:predicted nucleotidyltransferase component of viral defense system
MDIPLEVALSGKRLDIARMQDLLIDLIYDYMQPNAILYGGTAIWRCLGGGRFSEDIDIYVNARFQSKHEAVLKQNGLEIIDRDKELPLHMRISDGKTDILLEASMGRYENVMAQYTKVDGTSMTISMLPPAKLFARKMEAYRSRKYIRDLYDLVHLTNYVDKHDHYIELKLRSFLADVEKPVDGHILQSLVYKGPTASFEKMIKYLKSWSE